MDIWYFSEQHAPERWTSIDKLPDQGFAWINSDGSNVPQTLEIMQKITGIHLHERHLQDCLNPNHPSFYDGMQNYDLLIFRDLKNSSEQSSYVATLPIVFILFEQLLVTIDYSHNTIPQLEQRMEEPGRRYPSQAKILLHTILNSIVDKFLALRSPLSQQFSHWQAKLLQEHETVRFEDWVALMEFKTNIHQLEMTCEEQEDAIDQWRQEMEVQINENFAVRLNDLSNHIIRVLRFSKKIKDELDALAQLHYSLLSHRTNTIMRTLTVISAIFMPLSLIAGVFGMNFVRMPILQMTWGFHATLLSMLALVIALLIIFRYKRWI